VSLERLDQVPFLMPPVADIGLMPVTHIPEIGTENPYQKSSTIIWHKSRICHIRYHKLVPETLVASGMSDASESDFLVPVLLTNLWYVCRGH